MIMLDMTCYFALNEYVMDRYFNNPKRSLSDLLGNNYIKAVSGANGFFSDNNSGIFIDIAEEKNEYYPLKMQDKLDSLISLVGTQVCKTFEDSSSGSGSNSFVKASHHEMSPLAAYGFYRIGENGTLYLISKSEHYHASLGHHFPGYNLIENAKKIGIDSITHNNSRGHITRLLEEKLIALVNGVRLEDKESITAVVKSEDPKVLNRVINLETGSLAVEAGVKMMLARFYRFESGAPQTEHGDRVPVFLVMADNDGGKQANYHGTTIITQMMRGLWPGMLDKARKSDLMRICPVRINDIEDFKRKIEQFDTGKYKVAGFLHELILMNYGSVTLDRAYITDTYDICMQRDIPTFVDEIQTGLWSNEFFTFREFGLSPDLVSVGKGFPGGQFPASRIIINGKMDNLNQFGALVTNGQGELASLAYLITIDFAYRNKEKIKLLGDYYADELETLARNYPGYINKIEGMRHLSSIVFNSVDVTVDFVKTLNSQGIDISAHTYKANCPPVALTKLPITCSKVVIDYLISKMKIVLDEL